MQPSPHHPALTAATADRYARLAGVLYTVLLLVGPFALVYVPSTVLVAGDAAATAANVAASESLLRLGLLGDAVIFLVEIPLLVLLYLLFRPVSEAVSTMAAAARLAMVVLQGANTVGTLAVLALLGGAGYLSAFPPEQVDVLALLALDIRGEAVHVWEAFFGLHCAFLAWLLYRSGYFPRVLGALMGVAALGYLGNGLGNFILPELEGVLGALVGGAAVVGELPFMFWLLLKGVDRDGWPGER